MAHALIVDDIIENQVILGEILEDLGVSFDCAVSISEAVSLATTQSYEVVLMDLAIPRRRDEEVIVFGGLEAAEEIHSALGTSDLPIIAVTANGMRNIQARVFDAGICELVEKTTNFSQRLEEAIQRVVRLRPSSRLEETDTSQKKTVERTVASENNPLGSIPDEKKIQIQHDIGAADIAQQHQRGPSEARHVAAAKDDLDADSRDPTTVDELRVEVAARLASATSSLDQLLLDVLDAERDASTQKSLVDLREQLGRAHEPIQDPSSGPAEGETYGHWIVNLLLGAANRSRKILRSEASDHFGQLCPVIEPIQERIESCISLAKSEIGQRRVEGQSAVASPIDRSEQTSGDRQADHSNVDTMSSVAAEPTKRLILIVDDQSEARRDLETKLTRLDYRVVSCESARTALDLLDLQRFDVCLLDLHMPEMNGLEMIYRIRRSPTSCNASIIVVSGSADKYAAADAIEHGADDYLEKPADERLLQARIRSCLRQTDARMTELSKFMPRHVLDQVINNKDLLDVPSPADVTVIVCDVRGFSRISERVGPVQTINWISDVMNELSRIILDHGGTIIDYVGDEIMAMWGAPVASPQHAADTCKCALVIQAATERLSEKWRSTINAPMRIGIGINSGLAVVGNTGSKHRIKYGPLGDTVNVASRVQGATKYLHSSVLITQSTASRIDSCLRGRRVCSVRVQNISEPVRLFELATCNSDDFNQSRRRYEHALLAFESEQLGEALKALAEILIQDPNDGPAKLLMLRVIQAQLGGDFDPVWTLPGK